MTYIVVQFDYHNRRGMYKKLLDVFLKSVEENDPENDVVVKMVQPPGVKTKHCFSSNTHKLAIWVEEMLKLPEGHEICFIDCDMMVLQSPNDVFENDFDIAYTKRPHPKGHRLPVNGGVVFCRNNERSRDLMKLWEKINNEMFNNRKFHEQWRKKYAGMNQSAFGYIMEHPNLYDAKMIPVPCNTYNVCNEYWSGVGEDDNIRIVHIKSQLRKMCLSGVCHMPKNREALQKWLELNEKVTGKKTVIINSPNQKRKKFKPVGRKTRKRNNVHSLEHDKEKVNEGICDTGRRKDKRRVYVP